MKKIVFNILSATAYVLMAQNEGTAIYEMTIEGLPPEQTSMMGDMTMKIVWKGDKVYSEQSSMMYEIKSVSDENGALVLMDQMGNKIYMKIDYNDPKYKEREKEQPEYKIEYTNDTKKIAGYDCKKAIVTMKTRKGEEMKADVWYTEQIPNHYKKQKASGRRGQNMVYIREIKGMPLEYSVPQGQMTIRVKAKEINFNPVPDNIFNLSTEGYTEIKPEQMKGMGGGQ